LIVALLGATGAHWAALQSFAWATMLASNARTECLTDAIANTFDGAHPCPICKQIAASRNAEKKADLQAGQTRLEYSFDAVSVVFMAPSDFNLLPQANDTAASLLRPPPVPPPRGLQG